GAERVADKLLDRVAQHGDGERGLAAVEVHERERSRRAEVILDRREQLGRVGDAALLDAQLGEPHGRVEPVAEAGRALGPEAREQRLLTLAYPARRDEHASERELAVSVEEARQPPALVENLLAHDRRPYP